MKKKILLVSDTKNWGGWKRAEMIKKYLSDEFNFTLMDSKEYNNYELKSTMGSFSTKDANEFCSQSKDKDFMMIGDFKKWLNESKTDFDYDLIYFLFHTMLLKKCVKRTLDRGMKVVTIVTVYPTIRKGFVRSGAGRGAGTIVSATSKFIDQANKCKAIFANNLKTLEDLKSIYKKKTFYVPRGVDSEVFFPIRDFKEKPHPQFTVAFVGKPNPEKGLKSHVIPACQMAGVKLVTNERNYTNALPQGAMRRFYNSADVYIVASTMDGTPNTALEAASCGLPIISNEIGNMPEFIKKGVNGFLIPLDVDKYTKRLKWMKNNQEKAWKMGQEARQTVLDGWTWEQTTKNERIAFRKVINEM